MPSRIKQMFKKTTHFNLEIGLSAVKSFKKGINYIYMSNYFYLNYYLQDLCFNLQ